MRCNPQLVHNYLERIKTGGQVSQPEESRAVRATGIFGINYVAECSQWTMSWNSYLLDLVMQLEDIIMTKGLETPLRDIFLSQLATYTLGTVL